MVRRVARIGIIGGGWRATTFHTVARALPDRFEVVGSLVRTRISAERVEASTGTTATTDLASFLRHGPFDFVLVCVPSRAAGEFVRELVGRDVPVLCETPLAPDLGGLQALAAEVGTDAPVQVAEQYRFQPHHAARLSAVRSGRIGVPSSAFLSVAHDYHSISLLRAFLGIGFDAAAVTAAVSEDRLVASLGFDGWAADSAPTASTRLLATLTFPERGLLGIHDFEGEQYFSPIRTRQVRVRGDRGELVDDAVHWLRGPADYGRLDLSRQQTGLDGDLEGSFLRRILLGEETAYENPFAPARLSDDELAIATVLDGMVRSVDDGVPLYGLADASEDQYLSLLMHEAARTGLPVRSSRQPWHSGRSVFG